MEQDKKFCLGDSFLENEGNENQVTQFISDISNGKIQMVLSPKPLPKPPLKLAKKILKNYSKLSYSFK